LGGKGVWIMGRSKNTQPIESESPLRSWLTLARAFCIGLSEDGTILWVEAGGPLRWLEGRCGQHWAELTGDATVANWSESELAKFQVWTRVYRVLNLTQEHVFECRFSSQASSSWPTEIGDQRIVCWVHGYEISEREQELREQEQFLGLIQQAMKTVPVVISVQALQEEALLVSWNGYYERMFGYTYHEVINTLPLNSLLEEEQEQWHIWDEIRDVGTFSGEVRFRHKCGVTFSGWLQVSSHAGELGLELPPAAVRRKSGEFRTQQHSASSQGSHGRFASFLGGIAHSFNNLLMSIQGNASLSRLHATKPHKVEQYSQAIEESCQHASQMCKQLLMSTGQVAQHYDECEINELIAQHQPIWKQLVSRKAQLKLDLQPDMPKIWADATHLQQAICNLVVNASEALALDGGEIVVRTRWQPGIENVQPSSTASAGETPLSGVVVLEVQDNGCGVEQAQKQLIFEPFFSTKVVGRGLGLAIVNNVVRDHGGRVLVDSEPGNGSTFQLILPVDPSFTQTPSLPTSTWVDSWGDADNWKVAGSSSS
jgi:signal transduction histidine kinase